MRGLQLMKKWHCHRKESQLSNTLERAFNPELSTKIIYATVTRMHIKILQNIYPLILTPGSFHRWKLFPWPYWVTWDSMTFWTIATHIIGSVQHWTLAPAILQIWLKRHSNKLFTSQHQLQTSCWSTLCHMMMSQELIRSQTQESKNSPANLMDAINLTTNSHIWRPT